MSSSTEYGGALSVPITTLQYRDMSGRGSRDGSATSDPAFLPGDAADQRQEEMITSETQLSARIARERTEAVIEVEHKLRKEFEQKLLAARAPLASLIAGFEAERSQYYARVEAEIVQLALAIAAKILHREAQVDPMLVAALVRLAVEKMRDGSVVTLRVSPGRADGWRQYFASIPGAVHVNVAADPQIGDQDCVLDTELGSANFGLDAQLKEVEQGFFDLLALRPANR
ncbi:MAG TPA: FliH/SctL family protein [Terracidiphilus sp.]|jgi:flagellar assembly protein FliH|nr:FliH/SctL family protein [Terracidiphilus sp.]